MGGIRAYGLHTCAWKVSTMLSEALEKVNTFLNQYDPIGKKNVLEWNLTLAEFS